MLSNIVWILTDKLENVLNKRNAHINMLNFNFWTKLWVENDGTVGVLHFPQ